MRAVQVAELLARVAVVDHRQVDEVTVRTWQDLVGDLEFEDACAAVREHRMTSTEYLQPAHVRAGALRIAKQRRAQAAPHPALESGPAAFQRTAEERAAAAERAAWLRDEVARGRAGRPVPKADDRWAKPLPAHTAPAPRRDADPDAAARAEAERQRQLRLLEAAGVAPVASPGANGPQNPSSGPGTATHYQPTQCQLTGDA